LEVLVIHWMVSMTTLRKILPVFMLLVMALSAIPAGITLASEPAAPAAAITCPTTSSNSYSSGAVLQYDLDNPVRHADQHADKNLALRSYSLVNQSKTFVDYGNGDSTQPPQFATLFSPDRTPVFSNTYRANHWNWASPPNPGTQGGPITSPPVTVLGLQTTPGETIQSPTHGRNPGSPWGSGGAIVIYADADSVTLHFTREDTAAVGYTVHIDGLCTDPNLLAKYNQLDNNARNTWYPSTRDGNTDYNLAGVSKGQALGLAADTEIRVAIVDTGAFQDPRSSKEWWQIKPAAPALPAPALISPIGGITVDNPVVLTWNTVDTAVKYKIKLDDNADFSSTVASATVNGTSFNAPNLVAGKIYYWQVRAYNAANVGGAWSTVGIFQITAPPPPDPLTLIAPADGGTTGKRPAFSWNTYTGAVKYKIIVSKVPDFSTNVIKTSIVGTSFNAPIDLKIGTTYYWRVQAKMPDGTWTEWSESWTFTVQ
jgi:hypothetical protein